MEITKSPEERRLRELQTWMERTGTTQQALARLLGISESMMSLYVNGKRSLDLPKVINLAMVTEIPVEKLLTGPDATAMAKLLGRRSTSTSRKTKKNDNAA